LVSIGNNHHGKAIYVNIPSGKEFFIESCIFEMIKSNGNGESFSYFFIVIIYLSDIYLFLP
jgi:hypothetical protein